MKLFMQRKAGTGACSPVGRLATVVCQARGFGNRKRSSLSRKTKQTTINTEAQQLLGEYSALKESPLPVVGTNRAAPTSRTKQPTTEASAATHSTAPDSTARHSAAAVPSASSGSSSASQTVKPASWGTSATDATSPAPAPKQAAESKPKVDVTAASATDSKPGTVAPTANTTSTGSSSSSSTPTAPAAAAPGGTDVPLPLPVPNIVQAAGTRHAAFESKLTTKAPPAASEAAPQLPTVEDLAADATANKQLSAAITRLAAAHNDLEQAGAHVDGLAQLLQEAQATLASLQSEEGGGVGPEQAAVGVAAGQLVGLMSDVLADITAEMGLVSGQLLTARDDIDSSLMALEEAAQAAAAAAAAANKESPVNPSVASSNSTEAADFAANATAEAAAQAKREAAAQAKRDAAAAAERESAASREAAALHAQLELRDAELAVVQQRNAQLQAQLALLSAGEPGGVEGDGEKSVAEVDPRIRALLASQVASNMALLDWLAALAKTVVGLEGVAAADRVRLATAISKCVLAVGGSVAGSNAPSARGNAAQ